jgi:glutathione S-transferase
MPALRDGDFGISDSTAIVTYLETKQPAPSLIPADAQGRARTVWFDEFGDTIAAAAAGKVFFNKIVAPRFMKKDGDADLIAQGEAEFGPVCDYLESVVPASGYLVNDAFSLADISAVTSFVNAAHCGLVPDAATHPKLTAYLASILGRPSFAALIAREKKILGL